MNKFSLTARSVTFAAIAGLSLGLGAPAAIAAPQVSILAQSVPPPPAAPAAPAAAAGNINPATRGSLTIHKRDLGDDALGNPAPGTALDGDVPGNALNGVTFRIQKVNINVTDPAEWANMPQTVEAATNLGIDGSFQAQEQVTAGEGVATFTNLPVGVYIVSETEAPAGVVRGADFVVSVPMVNEAGDAWNYDVHAYPKNTTVETSKEVVDADKNVGQELTYYVNTPVPALQDGQNITRYVIGDDYDETKVTPRLDGIVLQVGDATIAPENYNITNDNGKITITFTNPGVLNQYAGQTVRTTIPAQIIASGEIVNDATVIVNNPNGGPNVELKTNEVKTYLGKVRVTKTDGGNDDRPLSGAQFALYRAGENQNCADVNYADTDARVNVGGNTLWTTGENGTLVIDGLHVTNIENNNVEIAKGYCLYEVAAPAGYALPADNQRYHAFTLHNTENLTAALEGEGQEIRYDVESENVKQDTPNLPMTGGIGVGILAAIGAAIVAAGAWFARRNSAKA